MLLLYKNPHLFHLIMITVISNQLIHQRIDTRYCTLQMTLSKHFCIIINKIGKKITVLRKKIETIEFKKCIRR